MGWTRILAGDNASLRAVRVEPWWREEPERAGGNGKAASTSQGKLAPNAGVARWIARGPDVIRWRVSESPEDVATIAREQLAGSGWAQRTACLVVLEIEAPGRRAYRGVTRILKWRARWTDRVAWLDQQRLCVALPETDAQGAQCFARRMTHLAAGKSLELHWRVYEYSVSDANGDDAQGGVSEVRAWPRAYRSLRLSTEDASPHRLSDPDAGQNGVRIQPMPQWKRVIDIVGASVGLILFSWVMLITAALIKLTSRGPVFFYQQRAGIGGKPFTIYKLRTMDLDAERKKEELRAFSEQDGPAFKMTEDPRVTRFGRILRTLSIDELPQFWNVLKGDMSLVGPRPLPMDEAAACAPWQRQRVAVTPGLTCIWQVRGRSRVSFDEWMRMDLDYIRRLSFLHDIKLLALTVPAVFLRRGAH